MKKVTSIHPAPPRHWVGNGFPVRSLFSYDSHGAQVSPFLLFDYAGPADFTPAERPRGVGQHPHRGFETVTIAYQGEVAHRDSTGQGGVIGTGDVQWMTAGSGIIHEEFHSEAFTRKGGTFEMVQLWVNLPASSKMTAPGYQGIRNEQIPVVPLPEARGQVRVIAGELEGQAGPAHTFSPMHVWDVRLKGGAIHEFKLPSGWNTLLAILHGTVQINGEQIAREADLVVLDREGDTVVVEANSDTTLLLLSGEPIDEPIVGYGPFVMNSDAEIRQAIDDYNAGRFGQMT
ncbi:MAG: quercetin 2,3-dioxygenase [Gammaproteobacteria bacterium HGW-Gammaproteobacteria-14]|nr:MAG: quercetin 2,3-dioxygenase [Gammaproteobacteria bacterium HGW-Gammaproteobacteria-14]